MMNAAAADIVARRGAACSSTRMAGRAGGGMVEPSQGARVGSGASYFIIDDGGHSFPSSNISNGVAEEMVSTSFPCSTASVLSADERGDESAATRARTDNNGGVQGTDARHGLQVGTITTMQPSTSRARHSSPNGRPRLRRPGAGGRTPAALLAKQGQQVLGHGGGVDAFDRLPDDLVLAGDAPRAASPADLAAAALTCRRFRELAEHPALMSRASAAAMSLRVGRWSEAAHRFLRWCALSYDHQVTFYCLGNRRRGCAAGARGVRRARGGAVRARRPAVQRQRRRQRRARAPRGSATSRRSASSDTASMTPTARTATPQLGATSCSSSARCRRGGGDDAASRFMVEWWALATAKKCAAAAKEGGDDAEELRLCSQARCGRRETRRHEFRRCSACGSASYCSRACPALDWKRAHRGQCGAAAAR
uniref:MYND-type domain-containing protein n=1 Tax=Setaria viridis TaxID=4556 RepID=A0A4U6TFA0_SETVI|nr:hypothetical protein SEVIR_8G144900v2 [Setaria viridis]